MTDMTRRGFLTKAGAATTALAFSGVATPASAQTEAQIVSDLYTRVRNLVRDPYMVALTEASHNVYHGLTTQDKLYANAVNSVIQGHVKNTPTSKGYVAYCVANGTKRAAKTLLSLPQDSETRKALRRIWKEASRIENTLVNRIYGPNTNPHNCPQVYRTYTY